MVSEQFVDAPQAEFAERWREQVRVDVDDLGGCQSAFHGGEIWPISSAWAPVEAVIALAGLGM